MKTVVTVHEVVDKEKVWVPLPNELSEMFIKVLKSVYPNHEWKRYILQMEFEARAEEIEGLDALHIAGLTVRTSQTPDKLEESGKTHPAKDGQPSFDFYEELKKIK